MAFDGWGGWERVWQYFCPCGGIVLSLWGKEMVGVEGLIMVNSLIIGCGVGWGGGVIDSLNPNQYWWVSTKCGISL